MRTRLLFVMALLTTLTAGISYTLVQTIVLAQDKTTLYITATFRESLYDQQGTVRSTKTVILAKRRDGSTVRTRSWTKPGNRGVAEQRLILDLSGGEEVFIDGLTESITTIPMSKQLVETYKKRPQCPGADEPANRILGYEVVRVVEHRGDPNNMLQTEKWLAPELDCFPLKTVYSHGKEGSESYAVVNVREALQVTVGEPAPSLFQKPSGYVERSPSERRSEYYNRYPDVGQSCPECLKENDRAADEKYFSRQSDRGK